jgi:tRNA threonylcarbamoyladenosine biosynthesis protein TsaB
VPVLALDTSAAVAVALVQDAGPGAAVARASGRVLAERIVHENRRHAELLAPLIAEVLAAGGADRRDITSVVVGTGPAPFTGLRAGLVSARMFALALGIPVHGVCSLDALAAQAAVSLELPGGTTLLVTTDARRHEVYWARYRVMTSARQSGFSAATVPVELVGGPGVSRPADLAADPATARAVVVGPGTLLYPELLGASGGAPGTLLYPELLGASGGARGLELSGPDPAVLAWLAMVRLHVGERLLPTEPLYLRRPDVVPPTVRKRAIG